MLVVISPAKTLDFETRLRTRRHTQPEFLPQSCELVGRLRGKKPAQLRALMGISADLAELNHARFQAWSADNTPENSRQALLAFMGDVYTGLDARTLAPGDIDYAQKRLRILSGLYGLLRPLDLIQPYRLEMGTRLNNHYGANLYRYWGQRPTLALNTEAAALRTRFLVNLASNEYFKAVDTQLLEPEVITPVFTDRSGDGYKVLSFFAKKARGMMARYIVQRRLRKPEGLRDFDAEGYRYDEAQSSRNTYVFKRDAA